MNCTQWEEWLADALADELSDKDRTAFHGHLQSCGRCRAEFEPMQATVSAMRDLPGPQRVSVRQEGNRLVLEDHTFSERGPVGFDHGSRNAVRPMPSLLRYAAGLLIAFTSGYIVHAALMARDAMTREPVVAQNAPASASVEGSLVDAHAESPHRSKLATCLIAMSVRPTSP